MTLALLSDRNTRTGVARSRCIDDCDTELSPRSDSSDAAPPLGERLPLSCRAFAFEKDVRCTTGSLFYHWRLRPVTALAIGLAAQGTAPELQLVTRAADALGGRDRVMAVKTLQIVGYGELAYFNGGGNITGDPAAPQKWQKVLEYTRTIDLEHWRTRVQQRLKMDFVFASTAGQLGLNRTNETLDGDVAYNIGGGFLAAPQTGTPQPQPAGPAAARQRRVELLAHPITIVRAALDPTHQVVEPPQDRATSSSSTSPCVRATR